MFITRHWRTRKTIIALLAFEFPLTVAALTLYALAQPDTYRQRLWQDGYDNGFNSSPTEILYSYANHDRSSLKIPMVWSQFITDYNVAISVLCMFILLTKSSVFFMGIFIPVISVLTHIVELVLYAVSVYGQSGPDTTDPEHPQKGSPWYLTKSCSVVHTKSNYGYCEQAKACFAVAVLMVVLYAVFLLLSIYSCIPTKREKMDRISEVERSDVPNYKPEVMSSERPWEKGGSEVCLASINPGARNAYTPRTVAFQTLEGSEGTQSSRNLPFRERYGEHEENGSTS